MSCQPQSGQMRCRGNHAGQCQSIRLASLAIGVVLAFAMMGCSSKSDLTRYQISGTVTFDDLPIPTGEIFFQPDSKAGNPGPGSMGMIEDSQYSIPVERGVLGGAYIVSIIGYSSTGDSGSGPIPLRGDPLFTQYVVKVDLPGEASEQDFEVPVPNGAPKIEKAPE